MCGIIGYKGFRSSKEVLLNSLKRMEYRGYDSAGIALANSQGKIKSFRAVGKLNQLKNHIGDTNCFGNVGIGHIRWATHGKVSERNAHPHQSQDIYLVHNGVIENAQQLKKDLNVSFSSETDTEVVVHYLAKLYKKNGSLKNAALSLMGYLQGEYAIIAFSEKHPGELVAFKKGPSLIIGFGENELFIASDMQAFVPYTQKLVFLKDNELVYIKEDVCFYSIENKRIKKSPSVVPLPTEDSDVIGEYPHFMLKEIYEQPTRILKLLQSNVHLNKQQVHLNIRGQKDILENIIRTKRLGIVACGSSYYAALYGKYIIEVLANISVEVDIASEFRYRQSRCLSGIPMLFISQSGETADTLAALRSAKELSCLLLSISNVRESAIERESIAQLDMQAGIEKSVASTKAFTCTLSMLFLFALALGRKTQRVSAAQEKKWIQTLLQLPSKMEEVLASNNLLSVALQLKKLKAFIYLGRGVYYPLALEGALKMKELSYLHAEGYPAGEMKHGPLALVDSSMAVLVLVPPIDDVLHSKVLTNMEEIRARNGKLFIISTAGDKASESLADQFIPLPFCHTFLNPILASIPLQLMAYHLACVIGNDVDHPRNLAKSVTVE